MNNLAILPQSNCASESADEVNASRTLLHLAVSTDQRTPSKKTARMGDEGKAVRRRGAPTALLFSGSSAIWVAKNTYGAEQPFGTSVSG